jgi:hypothetical protein
MGLRRSKHAPDSGLALVLVKALVEASPPLEEHALADELEPWCEQE